MRTVTVTVTWGVIKDDIMDVESSGILCSLLISVSTIKYELAKNIYYIPFGNVQSRFSLRTGKLAHSCQEK